MLSRNRWAASSIVKRRLATRTSVKWPLYLILADAGLLEFG